MSRYADIDKETQQQMEEAMIKDGKEDLVPLLRKRILVERLLEILHPDQSVEDYFH